MPVIKETDGAFIYELEDDETIGGSDAEDFDLETELKKETPPKGTQRQSSVTNRTKTNAIASPPATVRENSIATKQRQGIQSASSNASSLFYEPDIQESREHCCVKRDCGSCPNICHVMLAVTIAISIVLVFALIATKTARQQDANLNAPQPQKGNLVGEKCAASTDCTFGAICVSTRCQCTAESYFDAYYGKCLSLKSVNQSCLENRECNTFNRLVCVNSFCACPMQTVWANYYGTMECVRTREVGETCQDSSHCVSSSQCTTINGVKRCSCYYTSNLFLNGISGQCESVRRVNERCFGWYQECPALTTCRSGNNGDPNTFCYCIEGYYYDSTSESCIQYGTINADCSSTYPCNSIYGLTCQTNKCQCIYTQFWNGTYCYPYASYGQKCSSTTLPCLKTDSNLVCGIPPGGVSQTMCYCTTNYYFDEYTGLCTRIRSEGATCYESSDCDDYAVCGAQTCYCLPGYWSNPTTGACEVYLSYGDACSSTPGTKPCNSMTNGINCYAGLCICDPTYEYWDSTLLHCFRRRQYQEACDTTYLCAGYRGLSCVSGTCNCVAPLTWSTLYYYCL